jgi:hypothetical protein
MSSSNPWSFLQPTHPMIQNDAQILRPSGRNETRRFKGKKTLEFRQRLQFKWAGYLPLLRLYECSSRFFLIFPKWKLPKR